MVKSPGREAPAASPCSCSFLPHLITFGDQSRPPRFILVSVSANAYISWLVRKRWLFHRLELDAAFNVCAVTWGIRKTPCPQQEP